VLAVALPKSYLTSVKNLEDFLNAIRGAQAPTKFTTAFLESLEFKSSSDRLFIAMLKVLGFLDDTGRPTDRYFKYLDQTQSDKVMAEALREAFEDLFRVNKNAQTLSRQELINKFKTLSQGSLSDSVLDKLAMTFTALAKHADFTAPPTPDVNDPSVDKNKDTEKGKDATAKDGHGDTDHDSRGKGLRLGGLVYNIQIVLPDSRDPSVYDALFQSLKRHLL
jgi:hypothetical protein